MASSALRRSLPRGSSLRRILPSSPPPPSPASAAAATFRRSFLSGGGDGVGESVEEFEKRMLGGLDDGLENRRGGSDWGWRGGFRNRGNSSSILAELGTGFDSLEDGLDEKLDEASRTFHVTEEYEDDDYDYRPDVTFRRGSTYNVKDLDLTRPAAAKNPPRPQFQTTTEEVLKKADFRNVRFLANFLTEAGIIIKRSQTRISAKAQRKVAREIKTARALGLLPFTTMGQRPFIYGRSVEVNLSEEEYGYDFVDRRAGEPDENADDAVPDEDVAPGVENA
uniref:Small ribosomal subunit protein bS18c n=1 Tax=Oryza glumipatula TaxID=40148 RepID=A0A0E0BCC4_9ORYZ